MAKRKQNGALKGPAPATSSRPSDRSQFQKSDSKPASRADQKPTDADPPRGPETISQGRDASLSGSRGVGAGAAAAKPQTEIKTSSDKASGTKAETKASSNPCETKAPELAETNGPKVSANLPKSESKLPGEAEPKLAVSELPESKPDSAAHEPDSKRDSPSPPSPCTPMSPLSSSVSPYSPGAAAVDSRPSPLSMSFLHRPSRAQQELQKASDSTKQNSYANAHLSWQPESPSTSASGSAASASAASASGHTSPHLSAHFNTKLVRKKSGEIVKPLLKDASTAKNRARSLPSTPTYKQVHFGGDTDVRYFKEKDRPTAISAQNSPAASDDEDDGSYSIASMGYDSDEDELHARIAHLSGSASNKSYFDYYDDELNSHVDHTTHRPRHSPVSAARSQADWSLKMSRFSMSSYRENIVTYHKPVFLENVFLSVDKKYLLGQIAVMNLAFEKEITVRYTLDNWDTILEIRAVYIPDAPSILKTYNYDRFMFKLAMDRLLGLSPDAGSEVSAQFCIKYTVPGQEMWDSNNGENYHFSLKQSRKAQKSHQAAEVPKTAMTKHEAHTQRPKYSSTYLKKMNSEPSLAKQDHFAIEEPKTKKKDGFFNDFEHNDYYLSSPLLSNYKNLAAEDEFLKSERSELPIASSGGGRPPISEVINRPSSSKADEVKEEAAVPADPQAPRNSKKLHESMTYKELLDSYCFFNSNPAASGVDASSSESPEDTTLNARTENTLEPVFTVSSFLM